MEQSSSKLRIPILLGTVRQGRESEKVAKLLLAHILAHHPEVESELIDPRYLDLPNDDEGTSLRDCNPVWRDVMQKADGLIIVTPEYNHSFPGSLKRALDVLLEEYIHKAVGLIGVSSGGFGGIRAVEALLPVVRELGLCVSFSDLYFSKAQDFFNEDGSPKDEKIFGRMDGFLAELSWLASSLKSGRENLASKYHDLK